MPMMRIRICPYKQGSQSAKALATSLGGRVLRLQGSNFHPRHSDMLINWGSSIGFPVPRVLNVPVCKYLNSQEDVVRATNKLLFFDLMKENGHEEIIPRYWTDKDSIPDDAFPVVCRKLLNGHSGAGIVLAFSRDDLVDAPLFVEYKKKKDEYRVHVGIGGSGDVEIIALQRKAKRVGYENPNWQIRNHSNGFVFVRSDVNPHESVVSSAKKALEATGLDFGAVDVIWNEHENKAYVLEINTAPGLEGQTVTDYADFFKGLM